MTSYLNHGVKAKMCETTQFVNTVGAHCAASRAQLEQACDSLRQQDSSRVTKIGLSQVDVCADMTENHHGIHLLTCTEAPRGVLGSFGPKCQKKGRMAEQCFSTCHGASLTQRVTLNTTKYFQM